MVKIMSKKTAPLPLRPEPPRVEDIVADIENVENDDVIFSMKVREILALNETDEYLPNVGQPADAPRSGNTNSERTNGANNGSSTEPDVETMYKQAVGFIELTSALKNAPGRLKEQLNHLQAAGEDLQKSIDELKNQSQAALEASINEGRNIPP